MARTQAQKAKRLAARNSQRQRLASDTRDAIQQERIITRSLRKPSVWQDMQNLSQRDKSALQRSEQGQSFTRSHLNNPRLAEQASPADVVMIDAKRSHTYPSHSRLDVKKRMARKELRKYIRAGRAIGLTAKKVKELFALEFPYEWNLLNS